MSGSAESLAETRSPSSAAAGVCCAGAAGPSRASVDDPAGPATMESVSDTAEDARAWGAVLGVVGCASPAAAPFCRATLR